MFDTLLLLSGNDIPFVEAEISIHQPRLYEIAYIGEDNFYHGCEYLNFSKENLSDQDKIRLEKYDDFEILMTIIKDKNIAIVKNKTCMEMILSLLFPDFKVNFLPMSILLTRKVEDKVQQHLIDKNNFSKFKTIIQEIFCLTQVSDTSSKYNPGGPQAKALVQKFKKRQQKLAELRRQENGKNTISILSQYASILSIGCKKSINEILQYTIYQLFDAFQRFRLKDNFDIYIQAKMAGAKDLNEIQNWMKDIHS